MEVYLLNRFLYLLNSLNKTLKKILENGKNTLEVREICQSENVGTMLPLHQQLHLQISWFQAFLSVSQGENATNF